MFIDIRPDHSSGKMVIVKPEYETTSERDNLSSRAK